MQYSIYDYPGSRPLPANTVAPRPSTVHQTQPVPYPQPVVHVAPPRQTVDIPPPAKLGIELRENVEVPSPAELGIKLE